MMLLMRTPSLNPNATPQWDCERSEAISSFLDRGLPRRPIGLLTMTGEGRTLTNNCHFERAVKRRRNDRVQEPVMQNEVKHLVP